MRLISFGVNNFRGISGGIDDNTINFTDTNTLFIFGQNNVGKSTFLKAYDFFYSNTKANEGDLYKKDVSGKIEFQLILEIDDFDLRKDAISRKAEALRSWMKDGKFLTIRREISFEVTGGKVVCKNTKNFTLNPGTSEWEVKNYGGIGLDTVFQASLPKPILIKAMPTEEEAETVINEILREKAEKGLKATDLMELASAQEKIKELQNKIYNPASIVRYKEEVNSHFQKLFPETKIDLEESDKVTWTENKFGKKFSIAFQKIDGTGRSDTDIPSDYSTIGHGAIRSAIFSLLLMKDVAEEFERMSNRKDYIVLFEEPELFLHPRLLKELRQLIYEVSEDVSPYQVLCASHSPQMIDITKPKSSLIRIVKSTEGTCLNQVDDEYLAISRGITDKEQLRQEMFEMLRFNPHICESFYADEVILVEGPTEEIILRGYATTSEGNKDVFIVNCGTVNNIPFYQKIFSRFRIKYHVICDVDDSTNDGIDANGVLISTSGIQKTIYDQYMVDRSTGIALNLFHHDKTFEPAHNMSDIPVELRLNPDDYNKSDGKPYNANLYWKNVLLPNLRHPDIDRVPIMHYAKKIF